MNRMIIKPISKLARLPAGMASAALLKVKTHVKGRLIEIVESPDRHGKNAERLFALLKRYAAFVGVDEMFIRRADEVRHSTNSLTEAMRFLRNYIKLAKGLTVGSFYDDFVFRLKTDEEKEATKKLLAMLMARSRPGTSRYINAQVQLFRLNEARPDDPEVISFVRENIERSIAKRLSTYKSRKYHFTKEDALATMVEAREIFDRHGKRFCLISGTLLGAVRDKDFISNDYDIDLGVLSSEVSLAEIKKMFEGTDFRLTEDYEYKLGYVSRQGIIIEFFLCVQENGYLMMQGWKDVHRWYFSDFDLIEYDFLGHKFWVPDQYERNLTENFGNWRTKPLFYDLSYDVPARVYGQNTEALLYLVNRMCNSLANGWRYYAHEPAKHLRDYFDIDYTDYFPRPVGEPVLSPGYLRRTYNPIIVLGAFEVLEPHVLRVLESAATLNDKVVVGILAAGALDSGNGPGLLASDKERLELAKSIRYVSEAYVETHILNGDSSSLTSLEPSCIVVERKYAHLLFDSFAGLERKMPASKGEEQPSIVVFDEDTVCLTKDENDAVIARQYKKGNKNNGLGTDLGQKGQGAQTG